MSTSTELTELHVLELFCGVGGMHMALKSEWPTTHCSSSLLHGASQ